MTETTNALTLVNLTRYALNTSKQIGYIDIDVGTPIMLFVRSKFDITPMILVFVKSNNTISILIEQDGIPYINVSSLPDEIKWKIVRPKKIVDKGIIPDKQPLLALDTEPQPTLKQIVKTQPTNIIKARKKRTVIRLDAKDAPPSVPVPIVPAPVAPVPPASVAPASVAPIAPSASTVKPKRSVIRLDAKDVEILPE